MLDLRELAALRAVNDTGSVAAAARALGWSQPTVAHHLRALDRLIGEPTTAASAAGTALTPAGAQLLPHARAILDRAARAQAELGATVAARRGQLSLGVFPTAGARLVPPVLRALREDGHGVSVREAERPELLAGLESLAFDAAIVFAHPSQPTPAPAHARRRAIFAERLVLVVPRAHPLAGHPHAQLHLADFAADDWIFGTDDDDPTDLALQLAARAAGFEPHVSVRSDDYAVIAGYIEAGFGIALFPELMLPRHASALTTVSLDEPELAREIELLTSDYVDPALADHLEALLKARAAALLAETEGGRR